MRLRFIPRIHPVDLVCVLLALPACGSEPERAFFSSAGGVDSVGGSYAVGGEVGAPGGGAGPSPGRAGADAGGGAGLPGVGVAGSAGTGGSATTSAGSDRPIGFASMNGSTSGGEGGERVTASTYAQLKMYAEGPTRYVIMVEGTISNGPSGGKIDVGSNKSLIGVGSTAFLDGVGLDINSASNVIIRNLRISMTGVTTRADTPGVYISSGAAPRILVNDGDAISIRGTSKNVWIDHCELFSEDPGVQTNKDLYDGLIDIKDQTGFITISWCHLHDHHKGGLVGSSDTDLFADRKVTYHHNYYQNVRLRAPLYRGAVGHFFNNYVVGATDATELRAATCVRVEKNHYESLHYSIYTPTDAPGSAERIDNVEVSRAERAYPADCVADIPYDYAAALTSTSEVSTVVPRLAGVGKLQPNP